MTVPTVQNRVLLFTSRCLRDSANWMGQKAHAFSSARDRDPVSRHQNVRSFRTVCPGVSDAAFIAPSALVAGNVSLGHGTSCMYGAVVKNNNVASVTTIGDNTTIMDRASVCGVVNIGDNCLIGIGCSIDNCSISHNVVIGNGAVVAMGCEIEDGAVIAPGTVVPQDTRVGAGEIWAGNEAEKIDMVTAHQATQAHELVLEACEAAEANQASVKKLFAANENLDLEWFKTVLKQVEEQERNVTIATASVIPLEARRFVQPRVNTRRFQQNLRTTNRGSSVAPWYHNYDIMGTAGIA